MKTEPTFPEDFYIIDVGMHIGSDSEYYANRGFKVIAFEANPELAQAGAKKFAAAGLPIEVRNLAVSSQGKGIAKFFVNATSTQFSSLNLEIGSRRGGSREIDVNTCNLCEELRPIADLIHYIKIDIEGADFDALTQLRDLPRKPPYISVENGGKQFADLLKEIGYTRFKYSNQKFNSKQWVPRNSPHGNYVKHFFPAHSSGPFGEDIPGRWLSHEEAVTVGEALTTARKLAPNGLFAESLGWFDMHAAF
jgi:FkbM family methyltransferase